MEKSWKINVEKEGAPCSYAYSVDSDCAFFSPVLHHLKY